MVCRTAVLGGHTQACPDGHYQRVWYNSCEHRMCPQCAYLQVQKWLAKQKTRILRCDHFHVIFTKPDELRFLWHFNTKLMTQILFTCSRDALFELLGDQKYMGAKPGIIALLHTWTKTLLVHPHIHCLVTGCGLTASGELKVAVKDFLLPYDLIKDTFRKHVRKAILKLCGQQPIEEPDNLQWQDCFKDSDDHPELCPICGKRLVMGLIHKPTGMKPYQGAPPLLMPYLKQAA